MFMVACVLEGFETHLMMRGFERALSDYYLNPQIPEKVMNMVHEYNLPILKAMADIGLDAVVLDDDLADTKSLIVPPKLWRRFGKPTHMDFVQTFKKRGLFVIKHTDGNVLPILDDFVESGLDALHPIQPQAMDIAWVKEHYGDKLCLIGNVDCGVTLTLGTEADVRKATRECIDKASYGGGHVLCSSNSLHYAIPIRNVFAMVDEGRRYGRYHMKT
jgi:uroporphyrinogen decarboxylase